MPPVLSNIQYWFVCEVDISTYYPSKENEGQQILTIIGKPLYKITISKAFLHMF
jgi:hypothetical protein